MYVPEAEAPILSLLKLRRAGLDFQFLPNSIDKFTLSARTTPFKLTGYAIDDICYVSNEPESQAFVVSTRSSTKRTTDAINDDDDENAGNRQNHPEVSPPIKRRQL